LNSAMEAAWPGDGGIASQVQWWCACYARWSDVNQPVCAVCKHDPVLVCNSVLENSNIGQLLECNSTLKQDSCAIVQSGDKPHSLDQWKADQRRCSGRGSEVGIDRKSFQSIRSQVCRVTEFSSGDNDGLDANWVDKVLWRRPRSPS